jgi:hypothetical protein
MDFCSTLVETYHHYDCDTKSVLDHYHD